MKLKTPLFLLVGLSLISCDKEHKKQQQQSASPLGATANHAQQTPPSTASSPADTQPGPAEHSIEKAGEALRDASIYDLEFSLEDQNSKSIELDHFRGKTVIVAMFYTTCPFACPTLISDIKDIENSLSQTEREDLRVLLVTFDPVRDKPAALLELQEKRRVDPKRWALARSSEEHTRELANVLGLKYRELKNGAFNHSTVISVLDPQGMIVARSEGLKQNNSNLVDAIRSLSK